jgi:hypothetical protein
MVANEHVTVGSKPYEKGEIFQYLGSLFKNLNFIYEEIKYRFKVIIQSKRFCLLDFSRRI